jgi:hypothetical protein
MFNNRSFNLLVGLVIVVLAMAGLQVQTAFADCDNVPVLTSVPGCTIVLIPITRTMSNDYAALKDRALNRLDGTSPRLASIYLSSAERYVAIKAEQLEQAEVLAVQPYVIVAAGSVKLSSAERYANLKDAQLAQLNPGETMNAGRARYMNLKQAQFDQ